MKAVCTAGKQQLTQLYAPAMSSLRGKVGSSYSHSTTAPGMGDSSHPSRLHKHGSPHKNGVIDSAPSLYVVKLDSRSAGRTSGDSGGYEGIGHPAVAALMAFAGFAPGGWAPDGTCAARGGACREQVSFQNMTTTYFLCHVYTWSPSQKRTQQKQCSVACVVLTVVWIKQAPLFCGLRI